MWRCALVFPKHELKFSSLIAVCSSSLCKWAQRLLKSPAFNWRTQMCQNSGDGSRECPLVIFNYSQHAFALIQLNCCGKAEAQLLLAASSRSSGITHHFTHPYTETKTSSWRQHAYLWEEILTPKTSREHTLVIEPVSNHIMTHVKFTFDL